MGASSAKKSKSEYESTTKNSKSEYESTTKKSKSEYKSNTKKSKSKSRLDNIKSVYILKKIFDNIPINKRLKIIQYNKKTQKKLCLSINDYSQLYLPIEIEIKPAISKYCKRKFINIKKDNEKYYHIYFDGKSKEINRYYLSAEEKVNKIKILIDHQVKYLKNYFMSVFTLNQ